MVKFNAADLTSEDDDKSYDPIPEGTYAVHVERCEEFTSKAGNQCFKLALVVDGPNYAKRWLWSNLAFVAKAMFKVRQFLVACGKDMSKLDGEVDLSADECVGWRCGVEVTIDHGREENEVKKFVPLDKVPEAGTEAAAPAAADTPF